MVPLYHALSLPLCLISIILVIDNYEIDFIHDIPNMFNHSTAYTGHVLVMFYALWVLVTAATGYY